MPRGPSRPILVDTSVLAKWYLEEPDSPQALAIRRQLQDERDAATVELALIELANVLKHNGRFSVADINTYLTDLVSCGLVVLDFEMDVLQVAVETAAECNLSIYDAYFVAQADLEGLRLVTADEELAKKTRGLADVVTLAK